MSHDKKPFEIFFLVFQKQQYRFTREQLKALYRAGGNWVENIPQYGEKLDELPADPQDQIIGAYLGDDARYAFLVLHEKLNIAYELERMEEEETLGLNYEFDEVGRFMQDRRLQPE